MSGCRGLAAATTKRAAGLGGAPETRRVFMLGYVCFHTSERPGKGEEPISPQTLSIGGG